MTDHPIAVGQTFKVNNQTRLVTAYKPGNKTLVYVVINKPYSVLYAMENLGSYPFGTNTRIDISNIPPASWFVNEYELYHAYAEQLARVCENAGLGEVLEDMLETFRQTGWNDAKDDWEYNT